MHLWTNIIKHSPTPFPYSVGMLTASLFGPVFNYLFMHIWDKVKTHKLSGSIVTDLQIMRLFNSRTYFNKKTELQPQGNDNSWTNDHAYWYIKYDLDKWFFR